MGGASCIKSATDDVLIVLKADPDDQKLLYTQINEICSVMEVESKHVGLSFANDKRQVLLPKNWEPQPNLLVPGIHVLSNTFEDFKRQGMEIVGAPIGSHAFCSHFVEQTLTHMLRE